MDARLTVEETVHALAMQFMTKYPTCTFEDNGEIFAYNPDIGCYQPGEKRIEEYCERTLKGQNTIHIVREVRAKIGRYNMVKRETLGQNNGVLVVKNGTLNLQTRTLRPHSATNFATTSTAVEFDPRSRAPRIRRFLDEILDETGQKKVIKMLGDILTPHYRSHCIYVLYGVGANGKGTLGRLIKKFVGPENYTSIRLSDLAEDRFAKAGLYGKMVNFAGDLASDGIKDWSTIRELSGGDTVHAQRKFGQPFDFENRAKLIFTFNKLPELDDAYSTFRRLVLIEFERVFEGDERNDELDEELQTPQELSGLLNIALKGLELIRKEGAHGDDSVMQIKDKYKRLQDHVIQFVNSECIKDSSGLISTDKLQELYEAFCSSRKIDALDIRVLGARLAGLGIDKVRKREGGGRDYFYRGIRAKGEQKTL